MTANFKDNKVYRGNSTMTSDILCNFQNGKLYRGRFSMTPDIMLRIIKQKRSKALPLGESMTSEAHPISFAVGG